MNIKGSGNLQAGRDIIIDVISGLKAVEDIDAAIPTLHDHLNGLLRKKGLIDARILLAIFSGLTGFAGITLWNAWTCILFAVCGIFIFVGTRINLTLSKLDSEITATNLLLVELYKQKISRQF